MEKKKLKKTPAPSPKKKATTTKKKVDTKKTESSAFAPEATPYVGYYDEFKPKKEVSFWDKVKNFLGF